MAYGIDHLREWLFAALIWTLAGVFGCALAVAGIYLVGSTIDTITDVSTERAACQKRAERPIDYHRC